MYVSVCASLRKKSGSRKWLPVRCVREITVALCRVINQTRVWVEIEYRLRWQLSNRTSDNCTGEMSVWMFMTKEAKKQAHQEELKADTAETSHWQPTWVQTKSLPLWSHNTQRDREEEKQGKKTGAEILSELKHRRLNWMRITSVTLKWKTLACFPLQVWAWGFVKKPSNQEILSHLYF